MKWKKPALVNRNLRLMPRAAVDYGGRLDIDGWQLNHQKAFLNILFYFFTTAMLDFFYRKRGINKQQTGNVICKSV